MPNARITSSPLRPWRVGDSSVRSSGTTHLIQPIRLDVLVHFLAFEQLAGAVSDPQSVGSNPVDWLIRSEAFSSADNEASVPELIAELLTSPTCALEVSFASGGQLVRGAALAAAALYSDREITRVDATDKVVDRSYDVLVAEDWSQPELRALLSTWTTIDPDAAVVLIDLDAEGSAAFEHELQCRYAVMAKTLDFLSHDERIELGATESGSIRAMYLRAGGPVFAQVLDTHREAIALTRRGTAVQATLDALHVEKRQVSTSPAHQQRLRRIRRLDRRDQFLARALGR